MTTEQHLDVIERALRYEGEVYGDPFPTSVIESLVAVRKQMIALEQERAGFQRMLQTTLAAAKKRGERIAKLEAALRQLEHA